MNYILSLITTLALLSGPAVAQHTHAAKGNGGQMEDVAGVHAELMTSGNTITINVFDESNRSVATKGFTASALVSRGPERETVALVPSDQATLKGEAKRPVAGAAITVTLKTAAGKSGQARFKP